jgi:hypothetical protein
MMVLGAILLYKWLPQFWSGYTSAQKAQFDRVIEENNITRQEVKKVGGQMVQVTEASSNHVTPREFRRLEKQTEELVGSVRTLENTTKIVAEEVRALKAIALRDTIIGNDTAKVFTYSDDWMPHMRGVIYKDRIDLDYAIKAGYRIEHHWKATGLFKPKELMLNVIAENPAVSVNQVQNFRIVRPLPFLERPGVNAVGGVLLGFGLANLIK